MRLAVVFALAAAVLAGGAGVASAQPYKRVLLLFDEDHSLPGLTVLKQSFRATLGAEIGRDIEFFTESMNASQFPDERYGRLLAEYWRRKYASKQLDLIVPVMGPALTFIAEHADKTFPGVPIVFFGADAADLRRVTHPPQATGVLLKRQYAPTLDIALRLQPGIRRVYVVGGTSTFDRGLQAAARRELERFKATVSIEYFTDLVMTDLLEAVSRLPSQSVVLYLTMFRDGAGQTFVPHAVAGRLAAAANVPVYICVDQYLGTGVVGGYLYSLEQHATLAARIAARVLRGDAPRAIPVQEVTSSLTMFDARQLARWGIDERRLPADGVVRFRELTRWERYRPYVVALVLVVIAQSALIAGMLMNRRRRIRAETELRASFARIRELGRRVMTAQEEERAHLARELHDDLSQQLAVLKVDLQLLGRTLEGVAAAKTFESAKHAEAIATSVHDLSHRLHPARLRFVSLPAALERLRADLSRPGVTLTFTYEELPSPLPSEMTLSIFRVVQEGVQNALKHAGARHIAVHLRGVGDELVLMVTDDGAGFDVGAELGHAGGIGLVSMRERIELMGGRLEIRSIARHGTTVEVRVPLPVERRRDYSAV